MHTRELQHPKLKTARLIISCPQFMHTRELQLDRSAVRAANSLLTIHAHARIATKRITWIILHGYSQFMHTREVQLRTIPHTCWLFAQISRIRAKCNNAQEAFRQNDSLKFHAYARSATQVNARYASNFAAQISRIRAKCNRNILCLLFQFAHILW